MIWALVWLETFGYDIMVFGQYWTSSEQTGWLTIDVDLLWTSTFTSQSEVIDESCHLLI